MFDMRTVLFLTIAYSLFSGIAMIVFGFYRDKVMGLKMIGLGIIINGIGFLILAGRDYLPLFTTVIVANLSIYCGVALILSGFTRFRGLGFRWKFQHMLIGALLIAGFFYLTYFSPVIKYRIILITAILLLQFSEILFVIFYKNNEATFRESLILSLFFIISIVIFVIRLVITYIEVDMISFMVAGDIHVLSVVIFQVMPFFLVITIFWVSNTVMEKELRTSSMTDSLTGLYNRAAILGISEKTFDLHEREQKPVGVAMCDIDHFKNINDTYGHQVGDEVIKKLSTILKEHLRLGDYIGRYGGEEFILVLNAISNQHLQEKLEHLRKHVEEMTIEHESKKVHVTVSFGGYVTDTTYQLNEAINKADHALYEAKNSGRNQVCLYGDK